MAWVARPPDDSQQLGFLMTVNRRVLPISLCFPSSWAVAWVKSPPWLFATGILWSTGGLVKAYGGGVQQALNMLVTTRKTPLTEYTLLCDYAQLSVSKRCKQFNGVIAHSDYPGNGAIARGASSG